MTIDWSTMVRPSLVGLEPYRPGPTLSELRREHGLEEIAKLNWNEDLFGPVPGALDAVTEELENAWMYPEQAYSDLRDAVATWLAIPPETVVPAHGIQALIAAVAHTFIREGDTVLVPQPTYGLYAQVSAGAGARVVRVLNRDFRLDLPALANAARSEGAKLVWVCDPNNPTGSLVEPGEWAGFLDALPRGAVAVVDEAYREYADPERRVDRKPDVLAGRPVVLLRTFSKIFGLAGQRVGYGIGPADVITAIGKVRRAFDVTSAGQEAALASLDDQAELVRRRGVNKESMALLLDALREHNLEPVGPAVANFLFVRVGDADALNDALLRRGVIVRPMRSFGAPDALRITAGTPEEVAFLGEALAAIDLPVGAVR